MIQLTKQRAQWFYTLVQCFYWLTNGFMYSFVLFDRYDEIEGFGPEMDKAITNFDYSEVIFFNDNISSRFPHVFPWPVSMVSEQPVAS